MKSYATAPGAAYSETACLNASAEHKETEVYWAMVCLKKWAILRLHLRAVSPLLPVTLQHSSAVLHRTLWTSGGNRGICCMCINVSCLCKARSSCACMLQFV